MVIYIYIYSKINYAFKYLISQIISYLFCSAHCNSSNSRHTGSAYMALLTASISPSWLRLTLPSLSKPSLVPMRIKSWLTQQQGCPPRMLKSIYTFLNPRILSIVVFVIITICHLNATTNQPHFHTSPLDLVNLAVPLPASPNLAPVLSGCLR